MTEPLGGPTGRPQFSIRLMLLTVAAVAVVLALMFQAPAQVAESVLLAGIFACLALLAVASVYGPRMWRPFCIGAPLPLIFVFLWSCQYGPLWVFGDWISDPTLPYRVGPPHGYRYGLGGALLCSVLLGYTCLGFRWLIERSNHD